MQTILLLLFFLRPTILSLPTKISTVVVLVYARLAFGGELDGLVGTLLKRFAGFEREESSSFGVQGAGAGSRAMQLFGRLWLFWKALWEKTTLNKRGGWGGV